MHPWALIVADEDATAGTHFIHPTLFFLPNQAIRYLELHVKTVKYFKSIERVQDEVEEMQARVKGQVGGE